MCMYIAKRSVKKIKRAWINLIENRPQKVSGRLTLKLLEQVELPETNINDTFVKNSGSEGLLEYIFDNGDPWGENYPCKPAPPTLMNVYIALASGSFGEFLLTTKRELDLLCCEQPNVVKLFKEYSYLFPKRDKAYTVWLVFKTDRFVAGSIVITGKDDEHFLCLSTYKVPITNGLLPWCKKGDLLLLPSPKT